MSMYYSARAMALVGTRFRAQGRGPDGLDCVGLVIATFGIPVDSAPRNYRLRGDHLARARQCLDPHFRRVPVSQLRPGDVFLLKLGVQLHLAVRTAQGFVHAHANIRRVVETPGMPEWPIAGVYRKRRRR